MTGDLFSGLLSRGEVATQVEDRAWMRAMLDFEAALAGALADAELASRAEAEEIAAACREVELDPRQLGTGAGASGTPVPALLEALRGRLSAAASAQLHRGATSQDVVDTAAMLVCKRSLRPLLRDLDAASDTAASLAEAHSETLMPARTLLQHALPTTFGLKAAGWVSALDGARAALVESRDRHLSAQLGGGAGTLAALGGDGLRVLTALCERLHLREPVIAWHSDRSRPALHAAALGVAAGTAGKVGTDVVLMAQTEVGEVVEARAGGSSAMPQKRNPVAAIAAVASARRAPGLVETMLAGMTGEHERAAGAWQAEAETLSELLRVTGSAANAIACSLATLEVDPQRMRMNLDLTQGLIMAEALAVALRPRLGAEQAQSLARRASTEAAEEGIGLAAVARRIPEIGAALGDGELDDRLDPNSYLGSTNALIDRVLAARASRSGG